MIKTLPQNLEGYILELINAFPSYRFIWRNQKRPDNAPSNLLTVQWLPQVDLLSDSRTKVFISHSGNHGAHEGRNYFELKNFSYQLITNS